MLIKKYIKKIFYDFCWLSMSHKNLLRQIKKHNHVCILSLHKITPVRNDYWPGLHPRIFDGMIKFLNKHFSIITFNEINEYTTKPKLILSFDDGFYDFIEHADPILRKHRIRANLNVVPSQLNGEDPLWNNLLYDFLQYAPLSMIKRIKFHDFDAEVILHNSNDKIKFGLKVSGALKKLNHTERNHVINKLRTEIITKVEFPQTKMLRTQDIKSLMSDYEIGVHSYSHNSMRNESFNYFVNDFQKCVTFFKHHNFPPIQIYAFPNGSYTQEQINYLQTNHIKHILLVNDEYASSISPYSRFIIAAHSCNEAIFQALGIKKQLMQFRFVTQGKSHVQDFN